MPFLVALLLVIAVHLALNLQAWTGVCLLADDRFGVGMSALFEMQGTPWLQRLEFVFWPPVPPDSPVALYRPFTQLTYMLEYPWFGANALGYHVTNSVLHCGTAMLWYTLVRRWTGVPVAALAVAVAFVGWPGHSEATHWIAGRVNLLAMFGMSLGLLLWEIAERRSTAMSVALRVAATLLAVVAFGCKESAILWLPFAMLVLWLRTEAGEQRVRRALRRSCWLLLPAVAFLLWFWFRSRVLGTWGSGSGTGWQLEVTSAAAWGDSLRSWSSVLMAPTHVFDGGPWGEVALWLLHGVLLVAALAALRRREMRPLLLFGLAAMGITLVAVAGLRVNEGTLEGLRHTYEPALCLALLLGTGVAILPARWRGPLLAALVLVHAIVLDQNRECWLRASRVMQRMERDIHARAAGPIRVFDAPGIYEGALIYLNDLSALLLSPPFSPVLQQGRVTNTESWAGELRELAAAAAAGREIPNAHRVAWADGELLPLDIDATWPQQPWPGVQVEYARIGRLRPLVPGRLPVQLLVRADEPLVIEAHLRTATGDRDIMVSREGDPDARALQLELELPADLDVTEACTVELRIRRGEESRSWSLGELRAVRR